MVVLNYILFFIPKLLSSEGTWIYHHHQSSSFLMEHRFSTNASGHLTSFWAVTFVSRHVSPLSSSSNISGLRVISLPRMLIQSGVAILCSCFPTIGRSGSTSFGFGNKKVFYESGLLDHHSSPNLEDQGTTLCLASTCRPVRHGWPYQEYNTHADLALRAVEAHKVIPSGKSTWMVQNLLGSNSLGIMWWGTRGASCKIEDCGVHKTVLSVYSKQSTTSSLLIIWDEKENRFNDIEPGCSFGNTGQILFIVCSIIKNFFVRAGKSKLCSVEWI